VKSSDDALLAGIERHGRDAREGRRIAQARRGKELVEKRLFRAMAACRGGENGGERAD
jgi:hypothetical protein